MMFFGRKNLTPGNLKEDLNIDYYKSYGIDIQMDKNKSNFKK